MLTQSSIYKEYLDLMEYISYIYIYMCVVGDGLYLMLIELVAQPLCTKIQ